MNNSPSTRSCQNRPCNVNYLLLINGEPSELSQVTSNNDHDIQAFSAINHSPINTAILNLMKGDGNVNKLKSLESTNTPLIKYNLGVFYYKNKEDLKAIEYFEDAINEGFAPALCPLGYMHLGYEGGSQNLVEAYANIMAGSALKLSDCVFFLSIMYANGLFVVQDEKAALEILKKSESMGNNKAKFYLNKYYKAVEEYKK